MSTTCTVTGRVHLNRRELAQALARLDAQLEGLRSIVGMYADTFANAINGELPDMVAGAWNAAHDAVTALECERARVEANPRPIPAGEAETWALVQANID